MTSPVLYLHVAIPERVGTGARGALRVHGCFPTMSAARDHVKALLDQGQASTDDQRAFIIDDLHRWLPFVEPETAEEVEELGTVENDDPTRNRFGSTCDLRRPPPSPSDAGGRRDVRTQRQWLEELLQPPTVPTDTASPEGVRTTRTYPVAMRFVDGGASLPSSAPSAASCSGS